MKQLSIIFLLVIYLLSIDEAKQLLKLPVVFQHFAEHKQANSKLTLLEFLAIHYLHESLKAKDYDKDMKLPFKTSGGCTSAISSDVIPVTFQFALVNPILIAPKPIFIHPNKLIFSSFPATIWQPPKSC